MQIWGLDVNPDCLLCTSFPESASHLFFECQFSSAVWLAFFNHAVLSPPTDFNGVRNWLHSPFPNAKLRVICYLVFQAVIYFLWRERNGRLHGTAPLQPVALVKQIKIMLRAKMAALDKCHRSALITSYRQPNPSSSIAGESFIYRWFEYFG
ncbi:hypothetical protein Bca4012_035480 [Brassica carinata]